MAKFRVRPKVALLIESSRSYGRGLLRGVAAFARTRGSWSLLHQEMSIDDLPRDWLTSSDVNGVVARVDRHTVDRLLALNVPIVDVRCRFRFPGIPQVDTDDHQVGVLAFEHLWERGFRRFAFCGFRSAHYSIARRDSFRECISRTGCSLSIYETQAPGDEYETLTRIEESGMIDPGMVSWLRTLEPPVGLLACNDIRGQQVLDACRTQNLSVPNDIGVLGVDDDDVMCPLSDPPLSSVKPDVETLGYRAAALLQDMMNGGSPPDTTEYIPPLTVVQRLSTQVEAVEDRELARVCHFIREHACDGINVNDVVEFTSLSRRQLERRFREQLQRTPHNEITLVQVERVKQLLRETDMTLEQIAPLTGYSHKERLSAVFKREANMTPGEYRGKYRA